MNTATTAKTPDTEPKHRTPDKNHRSLLALRSALPTSTQDQGRGNATSTKKSG
jgi:hypothetical protein